MASWGGRSKEISRKSALSRGLVNSGRRAGWDRACGGEEGKTSWEEMSVGRPPASREHTEASIGPLYRWEK